MVLAVLMWQLATISVYLRAVITTFLAWLIVVVIIVENTSPGKFWRP